MPEKFIPVSVREFILEHIDSIAELEALLLFRTNANTGLSAADVEHRLYISPEEAKAVMANFIDQKFLEKSADDLTYVYAPSPESRQLIDQVAETYARYLVPLTHFIHSKRKNKIQQFADAFRIRKD